MEFAKTNPWSQDRLQSLSSVEDYPEGKNKPKEVSV